MTGIRALVEEDLSEVAALHSKVNARRNGQSSSQAIEAYFRQILFSNPWYDADLPSWVYEEDGKIIGVLGIVPRRMNLQGRSIRVAVGCQFFVDPDRRNSLAAFQLLQKQLGGSQDATLADGANRTVRRLWQRLGGETLSLYNLHWVRPLRPARTVLALYSRFQFARSGNGMISRLALGLGGVLCDAIDAAVAPVVPNPERPSQHLKAEQLDAATLLSCLSEFTTRYLFRPEYEVRDLQWLLDHAAAKRRHGPLQSVLLRHMSRGIVGWYLYYLNSTGLSEVLQIGAREDSINDVLDHLFDHARQHGAAALHGRMEPRFVQALCDRHCLFHGGGSNVLFHSRNPAATAALLAGEGFLTRLEGEWWLRFVGETLNTN